MLGGFTAGFCQPFLPSPLPSVSFGHAPLTFFELRVRSFRLEKVTDEKRVLEETIDVQHEERPAGGYARQGGRAAQRAAGRLHRPADAVQAGALERQGAD